MSAVCAAGVFALGLLAPRAGATGLRVGVRLQQELHSPLVPVTRNFRICFQAGPDGTPVLSLCAEPAVRAPAAGTPQSTPTAPTGPASRPPPSAPVLPRVR